MTPSHPSSSVAAPVARADAAAPSTPSTSSTSSSSGPAATLGLADIDRLATLARIALSDAERGPMLEQLQRVFGVLERLRAADTDGVEPMTHPQAEALRERADEITEPDRRAENQAMAPAVEDGLYLVPKVID